MIRGYSKQIRISNRHVLLIRVCIDFDAGIPAQIILSLYMWHRRCNQQSPEVFCVTEIKLIKDVGLATFSLQSISLDVYSFMKLGRNKQ